MGHLLSIQGYVEKCVSDFALVTCFSASTAAMPCVAHAAKGRPTEGPTTSIQPLA
jgi:hypothetical protein